jgi:hypothetical protein
MYLIGSSSIYQTSAPTELFVSSGSAALVQMKKASCYENIFQVFHEIDRGLEEPWDNRSAKISVRKKNGN